MSRKKAGKLAPLTRKEKLARAERNAKRKRSPRERRWEREHIVKEKRDPVHDIKTRTSSKARIVQSAMFERVRKELAAETRRQKEQKSV